MNISLSSVKILLLMNIYLKSTKLFIKIISLINSLNTFSNIKFSQKSIERNSLNLQALILPLMIKLKLILFNLWVLADN